MNRLIFPITKKAAEKEGVKYSSEMNRNALFPSRLRDLRNELDVSQDKMSKALGISKSTLGLYETGDTLPDARTLRDIATYFNVSADWLLGLTAKRSPDMDIRKMCDTLRLSEKAVGSIINMGDPDCLGGDSASLYALNCMLEACDISGGRGGPGLVIPCIAEYLNFSDGQISVSAENGANISPEMLLALTSNAIKRQILEEIGRKLDELKDTYYQ